MAAPTTKLCGPSGGILSHALAYDSSKEHGTDIVSIYQMAVWAGSRIDQLAINWMDSKGNTRWSNPIGGKNNPNKPQNPVIWPPDDQAGDPIIGMQGNLGVHNSLRLFSIQFFTATRDSLAYGTIRNDPNLDHLYYFQCPDGYQILDLFGWADSEVDSLGVHLVPII